jgi:hypothetical protein
MAKAKKKPAARRKSVPAASAPKRRARPAPAAAMPRSMQNRGGGDLRKAVQTPRPSARAAEDGLS